MSNQYQRNNPVLWWYLPDGSINYVSSDGFNRNFNGTNTAPRTYTFPDKSGTFLLDSTTITQISNVSMPLGTKSDTVINLPNSSNYIQDITLDGLSSSTTALDFEIWTGANRTGTKLYTTAILGGGDSLTSLANNCVISLVMGDIIRKTFQYAPATIYASVGTIDSSNPSLTIKIYGISK